MFTRLFSRYLTNIDDVNFVQFMSERLINDPKFEGSNVLVEIYAQPKGETEEARPIPQQKKKTA